MSKISKDFQDTSDSSGIFLFFMLNFLEQAGFGEPEVVRGDRIGGVSIQNQGMNKKDNEAAHDLLRRPRQSVLRHK